MKQYKLKKWYPGCKSVKENDIINITTFGNNLYKSKEHIFFTKSEVENNPEFWEEIVEKDYEILSYYAKNISGKGDNYVDPEYIWYETTQYSNKWSRLGNKTGPYTTEEITNHNGYGIHSVKRLSDGEVFTVGDMFKSKNGNIFNIKRFQYIIGGMKLEVVNDTTYGYHSLLDINHYKKPLFTTEDGVDLFEGDNLHSVDKNLLLSEDDGRYTSSSFKPNKNYKYFSTKKAAEEYIDSKKLLYTCSNGTKIYKNKPYWRLLDNQIKMFISKDNFSNSYTGVKFFETEKDAKDYLELNKPKLLLITEDGKKFYSNDDMKTLIYGVAIQASVNNEICTKPLHHFIDQKHTNRKWFYDTGSAEEYLLYNKPVLSLMDVAGIYVTANPNIKTSAKYRSQRDQMIKLIKSKIYGKDK